MLKPQTNLTGKNALKVAIAASKLAQDLGDSCPPARAAASLLLMIFETIEHMRSNQVECYRLAQRCLDLLTEIHGQMDGRWDSAPASLTRNLHKFESILQSIHDRLIEETQNKWHARILRKAAIKEALAEYNTELDDAARSFQLYSLLNIHYVVGRDETLVVPSLPEIDKKKSERYSPSISSSTASGTLLVEAESDKTLASERSSMEECHKDPDSPTSGVHSILEPATILCESPQSSAPSSRSTSPSLNITEDADVDDRGDLDELSETQDNQRNGHFRTFHQSDIIMKGRSRIREGWWAGTVEVEVEVGSNKLAALKRYEGPVDVALKRWRRDVDILTNLRHAVLPQLLGVSAHGTATPFIILGDVNTTTLQGYLRKMVLISSISKCVQTLLRFYEELLDAALYLRAELELSDAKIQDYFENASYRVDSSDRIIIGLPLQELDDVISVRQWSLSQTLQETLLRSIRPSSGLKSIVKLYDHGVTDSDLEDDWETVHKTKHIVFIVSDLLSTIDLSNNSLPTHVRDILALPRPTSLARIREIAVDSSCLNQTWLTTYESDPFSRTISTGDVGCLQPGRGFESFRLFHNAVLDGSLSRNPPASNGWMEYAGTKSALECSRVNGMDCWTVNCLSGGPTEASISYADNVDAGAAWRYLMQNAMTIAAAFNVQPESVVLGESEVCCQLSITV
ncbi:hypothetical protein BXZ70DRAFT_1012117 [Cristinia sonorae]|uniref:Mixed lineage kinase domain-containing protein n=1 Tax=Cristinia sonorae TaxID=1940300 RepID=A0A8K0UF43_9AGAR|nr:hypothetical protein BXZ70DRAFT_1012117 [Cristinia sonorae]